MTDDLIKLPAPNGYEFTNDIYNQIMTPCKSEKSLVVDEKHLH